MPSETGLNRLNSLSVTGSQPLKQKRTANVYEVENGFSITMQNVNDYQLKTFVAKDPKEISELLEDYFSSK